MKSWKENNTLINMKEWLELDSEKPGYAINHWEDTHRKNSPKRNSPLNTEAKGTRGLYNSEYEFILNLLEDSDAAFYDDSTEDENILAFDNGKSTYRFYFDENDTLYTITEVMNKSNATKENPDMGIWEIEDFDVLESRKGTIFRVLSLDNNGKYFVEATVPLF